MAPLLAACGTLGSQPREAAVAVPGVFSAPNGQTVTAAELDRWWSLYGDAELTTLVEQALAQSTDARAALARLEEARAQRLSRRRQLLIPSGDVSGAASITQTEQLEGGSPFNPSGLSNNQTLDLPVSWQLDLFGRNRAAVRGIEAEVGAARFLYEGARASVASQVAQTLFQARGLAQSLQDARDTQRITAELARVARIRGERGLAPTSEAARADAELASAEAEVSRLDSELRAAQRSLLVLAGRPNEAAGGPADRGQPVRSARRPKRGPEHAAGATAGRSRGAVAGPERGGRPDGGRARPAPDHQPAPERRAAAERLGPLQLQHWFLDARGQPVGADPRPAAPDGRDRR
jgi:outer membrane protein TolC